jgi:hypothetical protein
MCYSGCMKSSEILFIAKNLLLTKGWVQGNYISTKGYCLSGCLSYATPGSKDRQEFYKACEIVSKTIDPQQKVGMLHVLESYNDQPYRTKEHVLEILDKAYAVAVGLEL